MRRLVRPLIGFLLMAGCNPGVPGDDDRALFAYNHSSAYVDAGLRYAGRMSKRTANFFEYHNWQVFVLTRSGDVRLTGPGLSR